MMRELGKQEAFRESVALRAQAVGRSLTLGSDLSSTSRAD